MPSANDHFPISSDEAAGVVELFGRICDRTTDAATANLDWGESGARAGQYRVDLALDALCVEPLVAAGFDVLSEESGIQHAEDAPARHRGIVVVDPLDGSTNASLGLPWFATSLCWVVSGEPVAALVANLATGERFEAIAGGGARCDGRDLTVAPPRPIDDAIIAVSGLPATHYGWRQFRAMGASALDLCAVARGAFDAFVDTSVDAHGVWDYAGGALILAEAGGVVVDARGRDLLTLEHDVRRTPVAASTPDLLATVLAAMAMSGQ